MSKNAEFYILNKFKNNEIPCLEDWNYNMDFSREEFSERLHLIEKSRKTLKELKKRKSIKQRTDEWYQLRLNMLTASDTYSGIKQHKSLIRKKALKINENIKSNALYWGTVFEPIAVKIYSLLNCKVKIHSFGLLVYDEYQNYGASPDGISDIGIMVEIKCPISREIKENDIPIKYYTQMQGQLAVCSLEECDYAEFAFEEISSKEYLELDKTTFNGMIVEKNDGTFRYSKLKQSPHIAYFENLDLNAKRTIYWKLKKHNIQRVKFNEEQWYNDYLPKIKDFWQKVQEYKEPSFQYLDDSD